MFFQFLPGYLFLLCHLLFRFRSNLLIFKNDHLRSSYRGAEETNPARNDEVAGSIPGLLQGVKDLVLP